MVLFLLELVCLDLVFWLKVKFWMNFIKVSSDYVDVSYNYEEMVRKYLFGLNNSIFDFKILDIDFVI